MTDNNELMVPEALKNRPSKFSDETFDDMSSKGFTPRLQLMTDASKLVKSKKFSKDHFALFEGGDPTDLGPGVDILIVAWRPKALDTSGETPEACFDPTSEIFQEIQRKADNVKDSGCMYGHEFLVYLVEHDKFATLFMGSKSARIEARNIKNRLYKLASLTSEVIEGKKYTWTALKCEDCNTPHDLPSDQEAFTNRMLQETEDFENPAEDNLEAAPSDDRER